MTTLYAKDEKDNLLIWQIVETLDGFEVLSGIDGEELNVEPVKFRKGNCDSCLEQQILTCIRSRISEKQSVGYRYDKNKAVYYNTNY